MSQVIRTLVVDDEKLARGGLSEMLRADPELAVDSCGDGRSAVQLIRHSPIELVFLDIQMRGMDGFGVIEAVGVERMPVVVFTTAYGAHAIRAFEAAALDYLLKPIGDERLAIALARAKEAVRQRRLGRVTQQLAALLSGTGGSPAAAAPVERTSARVLVRQGNSSYFVDWRDVEWIESSDNYARLWSRGRSHLVREPLHRFEASLAASGFVRTHRTALVRADLIREIRVLGVRKHVAVLADGTRVPVSRERRSAILQLLRDRGQG